MPRPDTSTVDILLVEDSLDDADLMIDALNEGSLAVRIRHLEDGEEAMKYLRREAPHETASRPDLILLDLCMPRMDGHEVLAEVKQDPELRRIPVVIMTASDSEAAYMKAYDLHANC